MLTIIWKSKVDMNLPFVLKKTNAISVKCKKQSAIRWGKLVQGYGQALKNI